MPKFRKKPVVIEAVQFNGKNMMEVVTFCAETGFDAGPSVDGEALVIRTLEGYMRADAGDWVIRGVKNECYPCKPDIFDATYEPVE